MQANWNNMGDQAKRDEQRFIATARITRNCPLFAQRQDFEQGDQIPTRIYLVTEQFEKPHV
jgi:hypothetical protein